MNFATYGFWPTPTQELLLEAALFTGDRARLAFDSWESRIEFDRLDGASVRLLPLLYDTLAREGAGERTPLMGRLRGIYRQTWYKNQLLVGALGDVLTRLSQAGIPAIVLKGVPLALTYYPKMATRPMSDADILIPEQSAAGALDVLQAAGFKPNFSDGDWPPRTTASRAFVHADGWEIDVHTRLLHECWEASVDAALWAAAVPLVAGAPTLTLAPEDHVLHVLAHGARRNGLAPVRWIADAAMVIRHAGPAFDWDRLQTQARERRLSLLVRKALEYLHNRMGVQIPSAVLSQLGREPIGLGERFEYRSRLMPGVAGFAAGAVSDYLRARARDRAWQGPFGFVRYVRDHWRLESSWQVPVMFGQRAMGSAFRGARARTPP